MKRNRINNIYSYIEQHQSVNTLDLVEKFKVSGMTIRRDLAMLEDMGKIVRFHGGAHVISNNKQEDDFNLRIKYKSDLKMAIGKRAVKYLSEEILPTKPSTIYIGSGSTVLCMAKQIDPSIDVQMITDNLHVANHLASIANTPLIMIGGAIMPSSLMVTGYIAEKYLGELAIDCTFIGSSAIDKGGSLCGYNLMEAGVFSSLIKISKHVVVLTDHTKLGVQNLVHISTLNEHFTLITDDQADQELLNHYKSLGTKVLIAKTDNY